jgi:hypothetical protein
MEICKVLSLVGKAWLPSVIGFSSFYVNFLEWLFLWKKLDKEKCYDFVIIIEITSTKGTNFILKDIVNTLQIGVNRSN